jgi:hypothetical protein
VVWRVIVIPGRLFAGCRTVAPGGWIVCIRGARQGIFRARDADQPEDAAEEAEDRIQAAGLAEING